MSFYTEETSAACAHARILLVGPPKVGKTTSLVTTAPGPVAVLNCDGDSALKYAAKSGGKFTAMDIHTRRGWKEGRAEVARLAAEKKLGTVIVDSVTLLADSLHEEICKSFTGFQIYSELGNELMGGIKQLFRLPLHVFLVAHMLPANEDEGIVPLIKGQAKQIIPALAHDVILFDYNATSNPARRYLIGPQKSWSYSGRSISRSCAIPADVKLLFAELGIAT